MIKKKALLLLLFIGLISATNYNINSCGSQALAFGDTLTFTGNITATSGSTITNGACVYVTTSQNSKIYFAGHSITNSGSSANTGILINETYASGSAATMTLYNSTTITGFTTGIHIISNNANAVETINLVAGTTKTITNANYSVKIDANSLSAVNGLSSICATNTPYVLWLNYSGTLSTNPTVAISCTLNPVLVSDSLTAGPEILSSNKLFSINGNFNMIYNATENSVSYAGSFNRNQSFYSTSAIWYLNNPVIVFNGASNAYTGSLTNAFSSSSKFYYGIGGYYNPLYFANFSSFPFYINTPDSYQLAIFQTNYTNLKIYWKQGSSYYMIASSTLNQDQYFYLQPNGVYNFELDNGTIANMTVTYTCPSSFSYCAIYFANGTYTIYPLGSLNDLFADVFYNITYVNASGHVFTPANNFLTTNVNITMYIVSTKGTMQYYGWNITKVYNLTTTQVCFANISTDNGSTLVCPTNGSGEYIIKPWFKSTFYNTYYPSKRLLFIGNATGLMLIGTTLSTGSVLFGWAYVVLAIIISALAVKFISKFMETGSGYMGLLVFWIFTVLWPNAPLTDGGLTIMSSAIIATLLTIGWYVIRTYF